MVGLKVGMYESTIQAHRHCETGMDWAGRGGLDHNTIR
jgi:hypothetical protein